MSTLRRPYAVVEATLLNDSICRPRDEDNADAHLGRNDHRGGANLAGTAARTPRHTGGSMAAAPDAGVVSGCPGAFIGDDSAPLSREQMGAKLETMCASQTARGFPFGRRSERIMADRALS